MSRSASPTDATLTCRLINPLLESVVDTYRMMLGCGVSRDEVALWNEGDPQGVVSARIAFTGGARGLVAINYDQSSALATVERFLGERHLLVNRACVDALSELANIIIGSAKSKLNMGLNAGLPAVICDGDPAVTFPTNANPMRVHYRAETGPFFIDFGFVTTDYA